MIRLDRADHGGGGELVFIRKEYKIQKIELTNFETIYFQIKIKNQVANFISSYKSPSFDNSEYITCLENLLFQMDNDEAIFIVGDLNMDL